jgi:chromosome segregation ATPase
MTDLSVHEACQLLLALQKAFKHPRMSQALDRLDVLLQTATELAKAESSVKQQLDRLAKQQLEGQAKLVEVKAEQEAHMAQLTRDFERFKQSMDASRKQVEQRVETASAQAQEKLAALKQQVMDAERLASVRKAELARDEQHQIAEFQAAARTREQEAEALTAKIAALRGKLTRLRAELAAIGL